MIAAAELAAQRIMTRHFIQADVISLSLERKVRVPNGAGGFTLSPPTLLPPQNLRLIPLESAVLDRQDINGNVVRPTYSLLGEWSADIQRGDNFTLAGRIYQIVYVHENRQYEVKAECAYLREVP